jgi:hypothetical protein
MRVGSQQQRRRIALATAVLWLVAVELLPALHLALHRDDHTHGLDGAMHALAHYRGVPHDHGVVKRRTSTDLTIDAPSEHHHAGGIAHHALATLDPPPPWLAPVGAPIASTWSYFVEPSSAPARLLARPNARGPPLSSFES